MLAHFAHTACLITPGSCPCHALNLVRAEVRRHHDHGVLEIDGAPLAVGHAAIVEHLQQNIENIRMRLFDFVEQDHRVRLASHRLRSTRRLRRSRRSPAARRSCARPNAFPCTRSCRCESARLRCRTKIRRAPWSVRFCRLPSVRGTEMNRTGDSDRRVPRASGESHRTPGAPLRPARPRADAGTLPCRAVFRARPASSWPPEFRSRAIRLRRFLRRRLACAASAVCPWCLRLLGLLQLRFELRQFPVLNLGQLVVLAFALKLGDLRAQTDRSLP